MTAQLFASLLTKLPLPVDSQVVNAPSSRRQTMSSAPSPLKSPVPSTFQFVGTSAQLFVSLLTKLPLGCESHVVKDRPVQALVLVRVAQVRRFCRNAIFVRQ